MVRIIRAFINIRTINRKRRRGWEMNTHMKPGKFQIKALSVDSVDNNMSFYKSPDKG